MLKILYYLLQKIAWYRYIFLITATKLKFSVTDFFSKCEQVCRKLDLFVFIKKKILNKKLFLCVQCVFNPGTRFANVWVLLTFIKKKYVLQYCANCFEKNYENKQNYTRLKNLFLLIFRILVPKINFWLEDRKLGCLHIQFWDFPNI